MHDLTVVYRDRQQHEQTRRHTVPNLLPATIEQMVDLYEGQIGTVVRVSYEDRTLYGARRPLSRAPRPRPVAQMRKIEILVDEDKLRHVAEKYPYMAFGERLINFLRGNLDGTATAAEFEVFRQIGLTVALDGFPASSEATDEDRAMQPLWQAVNTIHAWAEAEPVELKKRWLQLAEEAAMTAIFRVQQGQRGEVLGQWPMDAFLHAVWGLAVAMLEVGATTDSQWFGQEYARVVEALRVRGLPVNDNED